MLVGFAYSGFKRYRSDNNDVWQNRLPLTTTSAPIINVDTFLFRKQTRNLVPQLDTYSNLPLLVSLSTPFNSFDTSFLYKSLPNIIRQSLDYWQNVIKQDEPGEGNIIPYRRHRRRGR